MGRRRAYPHDDIVREIRKLVVSASCFTRWSDDADMYYERMAGYSPILRDELVKRRKRDGLGGKL